MTEINEDEVPHLDYWTDLHVEVYCCINTDYFSKCYPYNYEFNSELPIENWKKIDNPEYDPDVVPNEWPDYCKHDITLVCIKCPHMGYCEYDKSLDADEIW